jgi:hypothetical protein
MSAIVNTANAVTSALTIPPPLGIILAGIVGAMGLAEVKTITGTPLPEIPGAESGGFVDVVRSQDGKMYRAKKSPDHRGFVHSPTVITGEDGSEFIANADAVTNPTIKPVMDIIDTAQRQGTVQSLDLFRVLEENRQLRAVYPGRAKGGRISPSAAQAPEPSMPSRSRADEDTRELLKQNYRINSLLLERLKKPLKSNVTLTGPGSLQEKQDELNVIQKSANL